MSESYLLDYTSSRIQVILGSLLGDMGIYRPTSPVIAEKHCLAQSDYLCSKYEILRDLFAKPPYILAINSPVFFQVAMHSRTHPFLSEIAKLVLNKAGKKRVTKKWLSRVGWEGVAYWIGDDGNVCSHGKSYRIATQGFTKKECELLAAWLTKKGFPARVVKSAENKKGEMTFTLRLSPEHSYLLGQKIKPFLPESMQYKIPPTYYRQYTCPACGKEFESKPFRGRGKPTCSGSCRLVRRRERQRRLYHRKKARKALALAG